MTSAELKTLRESLGLSVAWLAEAAGVQERTVRYWENGRISRVPQDVAELLRGLDRMIDVSVDVQKAAAMPVRTVANPGVIVMVRYRTNADLWRFHPDFFELKLPTQYHAAMCARLAKRLEKSGAVVRMVYLDVDDYLAWLAGREDSESERAAWAAGQPRD